MPHCFSLSANNKNSYHPTEPHKDRALEEGLEGSSFSIGKIKNETPALQIN